MKAVDEANKIEEEEKRAIQSKKESIEDAAKNAEEKAQ